MSWDTGTSWLGSRLDSDKIKKRKQFSKCLSNWLIKNKLDVSVCTSIFCKYHHNCSKIKQTKILIEYFTVSGKIRYVLKDYCEARVMTIHETGTYDGKEVAKVYYRGNVIYKRKEISRDDELLELRKKTIQRLKTLEKIEKKPLKALDLLRAKQKTSKIVCGCCGTEMQVENSRLFGGHREPIYTERFITLFNDKVQMTVTMSIEQECVRLLKLLEDETFNEDEKNLIRKTIVELAPRMCQAMRSLDRSKCDRW